MATFLLVRIPGMTTPAAVFTKGRPGLVMDFHVRENRGAGQPFHVVCLAKGGSVQDLEGLLAIVRNYRGFKLEATPGGAGWLASYDVPMGPVDEVFLEVSAFLDAHGLSRRWGRVEDGLVSMRVLVDPPADADVLANRLRRHLGHAGLDAQVAVEREAEPVLPVWLEVLRSAERR